MSTWWSIRQVLRFALPLALVFGALAWGAATLVERTGNRWFEQDLALHAQLVGRSISSELAPSGRLADVDDLHDALQSLVRDDRIIAAAVCDADGRMLAATSDPPAPPDAAHDDEARDPRAARELDGKDKAADVADPLDELRPAVPDLQAARRAAPGEIPHLRRSVGGRPVLLCLLTLPSSAQDAAAGQAAAGSLIVAEDLAPVLRRGASLRLITLVALVALGLAALLLSALAARFSWRAWTSELYTSLGNLLGLRALSRLGARGAGENSFQPALRDVRELAERLAAEAREEGRDDGWTPARLRATLKRSLRGERVILCANREPYIHERDAKSPDGVRVRHPASGLVTALEPVMRACSGVWIAHGSGSADRDVVDRKDHVRVPPGEESYVLRRVWLTPDEEQGYYYGFANEGLWPLCHIADARPIFRSSDWEHYAQVNFRFADAVCEEAGGGDPVVLVQDYHYALVPRRIRDHLPRATIITFWHIPWPNSERIAICPWTEELLVGLLGSSILGFHTQAHCLNFLDAVDRFLEARIDREQQAVVLRGHTTLVRAYPISIEWPDHRAAAAPPAAECRKAVLARLALPPDTRLGVGVDRLDYTKGIEERLLAVEKLLEVAPEWRGRFTFVQIAAPSRTKIPRYQLLSNRVRALTERINLRFTQGADASSRATPAGTAWQPIVLLEEHHEPDAIVEHYRAADLVYVSSLHDGMNLVAKEFVAARDDEQGVLVLSCFTGASRELTEALVVNPYDIDQAAAALQAALQMPAREQSERMLAMRAYLAEFNVYRWAGRMLVDAARVRQRVRLFDRLVGAASQRSTPQPGLPSSGARPPATERRPARASSARAEHRGP